MLSYFFSFWSILIKKMPITNRAKTAVNTAVQNQVVPIMKQQATMTARGQLTNDSPRDGRPVGVVQQQNTFLGMVQAVNGAIPVVGRAVSQVSNGLNAFQKAKGLEKIAAAANLVGGTTAAISRSASTISGALSTIGSMIVGENSSKDNPVSAVQQVASEISGITKFKNPATLSMSGANDIFALGGVGTNIANPLTSLELSSRGGQLIDILLTHGKKTDNAEMKYRIILQFEGNDKTKYDDVLKLTIYRMAFVKSSTSIILNVNLPPVLLAQLKQEQSRNKAFKVNMKIYQIDSENKNKLKNLVFERNYVGRHVKDETDPSIEKGNSVKCFMSLYNPTLFEMDLAYTYNKIHNSKNPYEILQDYESYISSTYGDNFESLHILGKKNEFKYEQIVTQPSDQEIKLPNRSEFKFMCKHDADIPLYLNYKYKIDNAFSFYFYDDFDLTRKKEITRMFIALYDKNKFEKFKTQNQQDILKQTQLAGTYPFYDADGLLTPGNQAGALKMINGKFSPQKDQTSSSVQSSTQISGKGSVSGGDPSRTYNAQKTTETQHQIPTKKTQSINQTPDSESGTNERKETAHKVFNEKIAQVDSFLTKNCGFDFPRFGVIYAMNEKRPNEYLHTPISIVNVFRRENDKETVLSHSVKFLTVKFSTEATSEPDSKSESSAKGENKDRDATNKAKESNPKKPSEKAQQNTKKKTERPAQPPQKAGERTVNTQRGSGGSPTPTPQKPSPPPETPKGPATNRPLESKQTISFDRAYFRDDGGGD